DDFSLALDHLGALAGPARQKPFDRLDRVDDLLLAHRLDASAVLQLQFARHQQGADFHVCGWLIFPHFGNRRWPTLSEVSQQRRDELRTEPRALTRGRIRPARVSYVACHVTLRLGVIHAMGMIPRFHRAVWD